MSTKEEAEAGAKGKAPAAADIVDAAALALDIKSKLPVALTLGYTGRDCTGIVEIFSPYDTGKFDFVAPYTAVEAAIQAGKASMDHLNELNIKAEEWLEMFDNKKIQGTEALMSGVEIMEETTRKFNRDINLSRKRIADTAISIGKMANAFKPLVKKAGHMWVPWALHVLPFISTRNLQKYMKIAERTDCHKFSFLGVDDLDHLCSKTEGMEGEDRIQTFLNTYGIREDSYTTKELQDFKAEINTGCTCEALKKSGVGDFDFEIIKQLTLLNVTIDKSMINTLLTIQHHGGRPGDHLRLLAENKGQTPQFVPDEEGKRQLTDVNSLSCKLITTIDYLASKFPGQIVNVDREILVRVVDKIMPLIQKLSNPEEKAAA